MPTFDPVETPKPEWSALDPIQSEGGFVLPPAGSITNDHLADGISPLKLQGIGIKVYNGQAQEIANTTDTDLTSFESVVFNQGFPASDTSNANPISVPQTGIYLVQAATSWESDTTGGRTVRIRLNGSSNIAQDIRPAEATSASNIVVVTALSAGDTIGKNVRQSSGGPLDVTGGENTNSIAVIFLFPI